MKKHIVIFLSAMFVLTACSGSNKSAENAVEAQPVVQKPAEPVLSEAEQLLKSVQFTDEGIKKLFKSEEEMTPVEYEAYLLAYSKCQTENDHFKGDTCPPSKISYDVSKLKLDREEKNKVIFKLLDSKDEKIRLAAARDLSVYPTETEAQAKSFEFAKKEKNGYVLAALGSGYGSAVPQNAEMLEFVKNHAGDENDKVRESAAQLLSPSEVIGEHPELLETLMTLCTKDSSGPVSFYACQGVGRAHDDSVVPALTEILNDPEKADRHDNMARALVEMWLNFPRYEHVSKDAYTSYMNYLKKKPRTDVVPSAESLRINQLVDAGDDYKKWQKEAKYFKLKDMISAYADIAKDDAASISARKVAIEMITEWGTAKDLKALSKPIQSGKAEGIEQLQEMLKESMENKK